MKKALMIIFFVILSIIGIAFPSAPYYYFPAPRFDNLLPFTQSKLQKIKDKGIYKIEIDSYTNYKSVFHFNNAGMLEKEEEFYKKKRKSVNTTEYKYNERGLLTVRNYNGKDEIRYDSISYDKKGRINAYYAFVVYKRGLYRKHTKFIFWDLKPFYSDESRVVLVDSTDSNIRYYTLTNNEVCSVTSDTRKDSLSIEVINDSDYTKKYWYKTTTDSVFKIGCQVEYMWGKILTKTRWNMAFDFKSNITHYIYSPHGQLLRIEDEDICQKKVFFTYNYSGLMMESFDVYRNGIYRTTYRYSYRQSNK